MAINQLCYMAVGVCVCENYSIGLAQMSCIITSVCLSEKLFCKFILKYMLDFWERLSEFPTMSFRHTTFQHLVKISTNQNNSAQILNDSLTCVCVCMQLSLDFLCKKEFPLFVFILQAVISSLVTDHPF